MSGGNPERLYRANAWASFRRGTDYGEALRISFAWGHYVHHAVVSALLVAVAALVCVPIRDDVRGPGFVRLVGARPVASVLDGPVAHVVAKPGQRVAAGDAVLELHQPELAAQLERLSKEFDGLWLRLLRDPLDQDARQALTVTQPAVRRAKALLAEATVRAPIDGVVTDVRVTEGRHVAKGDTLFVVVPVGARAEIVAVIPAAVRPQVTLGASTRFWVDGADANTPVELTELRADAIGPSEVTRLLGPTMQGSLAVEGMSVVVTGALRETEFQSDGQARRFYQGMSGQIDVALDKKPILFLLVPSLRRWVYQ